MTPPTEARPTPATAGLPHFAVHLAAPDLSPWIAGTMGVPGFHSFASPVPGPHVGLIAIVHGNEIAGAIVLDRLLRSGLRPARGRLTVGFANLAAFARFDPANPTASRCVDEDMNRLWGEDALAANRRSCELDRVRAIRPVIDTMDVLLDLHSMLWPSDPLILCGSADKGRRLAGSIGVPGLVVADAGHASGRRLIDYAPFTDPACPRAAVLLEAGQHWQADTLALTQVAVTGLLRAQGITPPAATAPEPTGSPRYAEVTQAITASTASFSFVRPFRGGEVVRAADTLIAMDGPTEIRTPHDDCLLIMPSLRPTRGHTAVRLARAAEPGG